MVSNDGKIKVIDFGVAKAIGGFGPQTQTGIIKGKLSYMAPEQVAQKVVPATDVFGAGIVLHELLTGRRLFAATNDFLVVNNVLKAEIPRPSATTHGIPAELEEVLMTALSRDLSVRYANGNVFADALTEIMKRVPALRGATDSNVKRWMDQTLAEGARITNEWQIESSDENVSASGGGTTDAVADNEIELTGDDLMFGALASQVDPAVRAVVTQGLRTLRPEMLQRRLESRSGDGTSLPGQPGPTEDAALAAQQAQSLASAPEPPPSKAPQLVRSQPAGVHAVISLQPPNVSSSVDPYAPTPDLGLSGGGRLRPVPYSPNGTSHLPAAVQAALHTLQEDPQALRWLGAVAGLGTLVLLLLLLLLFRC